MWSPCKLLFQNLQYSKYWGILQSTLALFDLTWGINESNSTQGEIFPITCELHWDELSNISERVNGSYRVDSPVRSLSFLGWTSGTTIKSKLFTFLDWVSASRISGTQLNSMPTETVVLEFLDIRNNKLARNRSCNWTTHTCTNIHLQIQLYCCIDCFLSKDDATKESTSVNQWYEDILSRSRPILYNVFAETGNTT